MDDLTKLVNDHAGAESALNVGLAADSRYPYTYSADYLRMKIGDDYGKGLISRAAAAHANMLIAKVMGVDEREIACKLADAYLAEYGG
jgi:hypothetical protein